jgi:NAD/NADP transhydrogenase beta subunit
MDRPDQESALSSITLCNLSALSKNLGIPLESVPDLIAGISSKVGSRGVLLAVAFVFEEVESAIWFDDKDHPVRAAKNLRIPLESVPDLVAGISSKVGSRGVLLAVAFVFEEVESAIWFDDRDISHDFLLLPSEASGA